jgi:hypothetical protein
LIYLNKTMRLEEIARQLNWLNAGANAVPPNADQESADARRPHFPEGDFPLATFWRLAAGEGGHAAIEARPKSAGNRLGE